jgi:hypothetical protein
MPPVDLLEHFWIIVLIFIVLLHHIIRIVNWEVIIEYLLSTKIHWLVVGA